MNVNVLLGIAPHSGVLSPIGLQGCGARNSNFTLIQHTVYIHLYRSLVGRGGYYYRLTTSETIMINTGIMIVVCYRHRQHSEYIIVELRISSLFPCHICTFVSYTYPFFMPNLYLSAQIMVYIKH